MKRPVVLSVLLAACLGAGIGTVVPAVSAARASLGAAAELPKHMLTGYWHNFVNPATELKLADVPGQYDLVAVAFAEATGTPGEVRFGLDPELSAALGGYTDDQFTADVAALHDRLEFTASRCTR